MTKHCYDQSRFGPGASNPENLQEEKQAPGRLGSLGSCLRTRGHHTQQLRGLFVKPWFWEFMFPEGRVLPWASSAPDLLSPQQRVPTASPPQNSPRRWLKSLKPFFKGTHGKEETSSGSRDMAPRGSRSLGLDPQPLLEAGCTEAEGREGVGPSMRHWVHRCWARPLSSPQGDQGL